MSPLASVRHRMGDLFQSFWKDGAPPPPKSTAERAMHWLAIASATFFAATAFWECFGASRSGHVSTSAAYAMAGENMVHWKKFAVVTSYLPHPATPDQYYCHHPYGIETLDAITFLIFGHHWFTVRAAAIFCSVISPPLVYAFGRRAWGIIPASVATVFFSFLPIDLAFNTFGNLEEPTIAFGLLFGWASVRVWEDGKVRHLLLSAIGALGAANGDWAGLVFLGPVLAFGFFRAYVAPRSWYGRLDERMYARWFAAATAMTVGTLVMYILLFGKADKLGDLMGSYHMRSSGSEVTVEEAIGPRRKLWLGEMLTPVTYGAIGAGIPLALARLARRPLEIFPVAWFIAASFQYFQFKQGADIHIFWPHYYAPTGALAAGTLTATLLDARGALLGLVRRIRDTPAVMRVLRNGTAVLLAGSLGMPLLLLARMGIPLLVQSRKTCGRFDQEGQLMSTDADMAEFAKWAYSNVPRATSSVLVLGMSWPVFDYGYSEEYASDRPVVRTAALTSAKPDDPQRIAVVDTHHQTVKEMEKIAKDYGVQAVGPYWRVDRAVKGPELVSLRLDEHEPTLFEWLFISGTDLVRTISRDEDPWKTWEMRDALGLPADSPAENPLTVDELRIAHNVAVRDGDKARADELAARLVGMVGKPVNIAWTDGVRLQGIDIHQGPAIVVTLFWEVGPSYKRVDTTFHLKCKVLAPPPLWKAPVDYFEKEMAPQAIVHPGSWKPGYLYTQRFIALHRIGHEECRGSFSEEIHTTVGDPNPVLMTFD